MLAAESGWPLGNCTVRLLEGGPAVTGRLILDSTDRTNCFVDFFSCLEVCHRPLDQR